MYLILALFFLYCLGALTLEAWKALNAWGARHREAKRLDALQDAYAKGYTDALETPTKRITPDRPAPTRYWANMTVDEICNEILEGK